MLKIAKSTTGYDLDRATFSAFKKAGIDAVEVSYPKCGYENIDYEELKVIANETEIELWSYHLPFTPERNIDISNVELTDYTVKYFSELIDKASAIGIKCFVIHPSTEPIDDKDREARIACAKNGLYKLAEYAKTKGAVLCVEDLPRTCLGRDSDEMLQLLSAHPNLRCCFDTNHLLNEDICNFVRKIGDKIVTTHVSDYDFVDEKHWFPGKGLINWHELYNALLNVGYCGPWLYELSPDGHTPEDFVRNAKEIAEGKPLTK